MLVHWIWLSARPGISHRLKAELVRCFQDPENVFFAEKESLSRMEGMTPEALEALEDKDLRPAEKILEDCQREGLRILTYQDAAYPARLRNIPDPPLVFYYKGRLPDFDGQPVIAVVGTRHASLYGLSAAKKLGYQIARCGGVVVSGMAAGIDAMAMKGALTAGTPVVGVLGCGADVVYPASNRALFADMERYGCILSEFPPGTPPQRWNFPQRNRVISGMSCGVLVVEAPEKSGALITAQLAADQGRDVFVIPGNIDVDSFVGSNRLLRDGALAVSSGWDILSEYQALYPDKVHPFTAPVRQSVTEEEVRAASEGEKSVAKVAQKPRFLSKNKPPKQKVDKKAIDKAPPSLYSDFHETLAGLTEEQRGIVSALKDGERLVDDVIAETGLPAAKVLSALTLLEVKGVVKRLPGRRVRLHEAN